MDYTDYFDHFDDNSSLEGNQTLDNLTEYYDYYDYVSPQEEWPVEKILVPFVMFTVAIAGIIGNSLVVYVVFHNGAMKTVTNLYLANLSIADLLFLLLCAPFTGFTYINPAWPFGEFTCRLVSYLMMVTAEAGVLTLTAMGIDRYFAVAAPIWSRTYRTIKRTSLVVALIWFLSITSMIPILFIAKLVKIYEYGQISHFCTEVFPSAESRQVYIICIFLFLYLIPLVVIGTCYLRMAKSLWHSITPGSGSNTIRSVKARRKVARLVMVVVLVFGLCWMPVYCIQLIEALYVNAELSSYLQEMIPLAHVLSYLNSAVNPIIYSFMSESFRQCFREAFKCFNKCNNKIFVVDSSKRRSGEPVKLNNEKTADGTVVFKKETLTARSALITDEPSVTCSATYSVLQAGSRVETQLPGVPDEDNESIMESHSL